MITTIVDGDYKGTKVVIACPSVGNVSQLAVDLFIGTLKPQHIGMIWHEAILPLVGLNPYEAQSEELCISTHVYYSSQHKLIFVQIRSPLHTNSNWQNDFLQKLVDFFKGKGSESFVILAGIFGHTRNDKEMLSGTFRYVVCPESYKIYGNILKDLSWIQMSGNNEGSNFSCPRLSGSGFSKRLFNICVEKKMPCSILLCYCSEGDNLQDSVIFTTTINEWLKALPEGGNKFIFPPSWKFLFGNTALPELY